MEPKATPGTARAHFPVAGLTDAVDAGAVTVELGERATTLKRVIPADTRRLRRHLAEASMDTRSRSTEDAGWNSLT